VCVGHSKGEHPGVAGGPDARGAVLDGEAFTSWNSQPFGAEAVARGVRLAPGCQLGRDEDARDRQPRHREVPHRGLQARRGDDRPALGRQLLEELEAAVESGQRPLLARLSGRDPAHLRERIDVGRKPSDQLHARHVDRSEHVGRGQVAFQRPLGPGGADRRHRVDQDAVQVEYDRCRVEVKGRQLRGVIFDLDGVLAVSEPLLAEAAIELFVEKGYTMTAEDFRPFIGMGEDRYIGGAAEARGISLDIPSGKARLYEIYERVIRGRLRPLPGAREFVAECRRRGLAVAVASGADRVKVAANLREIGLPESSFDAVIDGNQVAHKKPAPDIFLEAGRRLGLAPGACLVIEDAVSGVAAARAAGMRCLALTTSFEARDLGGADWITSDLAQVPQEALGW